MRPSETWALKRQFSLDEARMSVLYFQVVEIFNSPEIRSASQPAISGVGTARGLARTFELFMDGVLVSKSLLQVSRPKCECRDRVGRSSKP